MKKQAEKIRKLDPGLFEYLNQPGPVDETELNRYARNMPPDIVHKIVGSKAFKEVILK